MPAVRQVHAHQRVARLQHREVHGHVRLGAGVRLHVGVLGAEQFLGPLDGEFFGEIDELAAAVVALARVALGVLVGHHRAARLQDRLGGVVLAGDHDQLVVLLLGLAADGVGNGRVDIGEVAGE